MPTGRKRLPNLRYADDSMFLATSIKDVQKLFERLEIKSNHISFAVHRTKTMLMVVDRAEKMPIPINAIPGIDLFSTGDTWAL